MRRETKEKRSHVQLCAVPCSPLLLPCVNLRVKVGRRYHSTWSQEGELSDMGRAILLNGKTGNRKMGNRNRGGHSRPRTGKRD